MDEQEIEKRLKIFKENGEAWKEKLKGNLSDTPLTKEQLEEKYHLCDGGHYHLPVEEGKNELEQLMIINLNTLIDESFERNIRKKEEGNRKGDHLCQNPQ